jgi:predicted kinase
VTTPVLVVFGGLPGVGKSAIAAEVSRRISAVYLRIDVIEVAMTRALGIPKERDIGPAGYVVAYGLARSNLALGLCVIADSVNPITATRRAWRAVAADAGAACLEVEVVCSNRATHRRRVEARIGDPAALQPPSWAQIETRTYEPWPQAQLRIDTADLAVQASAALVCNAAARLAGA